MSRCDRIIFFALAVALLAIPACGSASKKDINASKHSLYDIDFAVVYAAALESTRNIYPNLDDNPGPGKILTAWHQVQFANCAGAGSTCDDQIQQRTVTGGAYAGGPTAAMPTGAGGVGGGTVAPMAYKRYFVRFEVSVVGGRPWKVKVIGHAAVWDPGAAMPTELRGPARPPWLEPRTDTLRVAIYAKVRQYAVPMKEDEPKTVEEELPKTDPKTFVGVPAGAAKRLAAVKDAVGHRDYGSLRAQLADDVEWSTGGGTGADSAMAMWQADPAIFDAMAAVLASCGAEGDKKVACPAAAPAVGGYQIVIEAHGDDWKVTSFVKAE